MVSPWEGENHRVTMAEGGNHRVTMGRWKPQSQHGKGRKHRVNMGRWEPWSHYTKRCETTVSPWVGGNHRLTMGGWKSTESPWERGKSLSSHGVTMGRWKPQSQHRKMETIKSPQEDGKY